MSHASAMSRVPLRAREESDVRDQRRILQIDRTIRTPRENGSKVEAESVDMHAIHPETEALENERAHGGVIAAKRVAASGVIDIHAAIAAQNVVRLVVDAAVTVGRPFHAAFARVVINHVEPDFDALLVKGPDHLAELFNWLARGIIRGAAKRS